MVINGYPSSQDSEEVLFDPACDLLPALAKPHRIELPKRRYGGRKEDDFEKVANEKKVRILFDQALIHHAGAWRCRLRPSAALRVATLRVATRISEFRSDDFVPYPHFLESSSSSKALQL